MHGSCPSAQQTWSHPPAVRHAHPLAPLRQEPALGAGSHVAVLNVVGPELHVAFLIIDHVPDVAHTLHVAGPLPHSAGHRALKHSKRTSAHRAMPALRAPLVRVPSSSLPATWAEDGVGQDPWVAGSPLKRCYLGRIPAWKHHTPSKICLDVLPTLILWASVLPSIKWESMIGRRSWL